LTHPSQLGKDGKQ